MKHLRLFLFFFLFALFHINSHSRAPALALGYCSSQAINYQRSIKFLSQIYEVKDNGVFQGKKRLSLQKYVENKPQLLIRWPFISQMCINAISMNCTSTKPYAIPVRCFLLGQDSKIPNKDPVDIKDLKPFEDPDRHNVHMVPIPSPLRKPVWKWKLPDVRDFINQNWHHFQPKLKQVIVGIVLSVLGINAIAAFFSLGWSLTTTPAQSVALAAALIAVLIDFGALNIEGSFGSDSIGPQASLAELEYSQSGQLMQIRILSLSEEELIYRFEDQDKINLALEIVESSQTKDPVINKVYSESLSP